VIAVQNGVLSVCRETGYGLQIHPCDSSSPTLAAELIDWCSTRAWPAWCLRRRCRSATSW
jgi:hypothetical protein